MKKVLLILALVAASCTQAATITTTPTTTPLDRPATPIDRTTTTTGVPVVGCDEADADFKLLCEAVGLIQTSYVDDIGIEDLALAATRGVKDFSTDTNAPPLQVCAVPDLAFETVCEAIDVAETTPLDGVSAALQGLAAYALDPHSAYLDPDSLADTQLEQSGQVEGIGALVTTEDRSAADPESTTCTVISDTCRMVVVSPLPDSPAQRAGVLGGDEIVTVDGVSVLGWTFEEVTAHVRGAAGTPVTIGFLRDQEPIELTITRAALTVPVVEYEMLGGGTGYLRLNLFTQNADTQVNEALAELQAAGMKALVLDLRDNPGGSLLAAVNIASEFLKDGLVLLTEAPTGETPYPVTGRGIATEVPMVIVVNRGSASASEVVSAVLQEVARATVVGTRTFGKNTVQQRFSLTNGGAFKLTIARWVTPAGADFGGSGLTPDRQGDFPPDMSGQEVAAQALSLAGS